MFRGRGAVWGGIIEPGPFNCVDLATREALAVALNEFEGTVMLVSHDRALLRSVCDEFWLVSHGGIAPFDGDLDDYQRYLLDVAKQKREAAQTQTRALTAADSPPTACGSASPGLQADAPRLHPGEQRKLDALRRQKLAAQLKPIKQQAQALEHRLEALQQEQASLHEQIVRPANPQALVEAGRRLNEEIAQLEGRWMDLLEQIEHMEKQDAAATVAAG